MKKILLSTITAVPLVFGIQEIAQAAWKEIGSNEQMTVYVDTDTVQSKGEKAQIFSMLDFKKPGTNPQNKKVVNSLVGLNEFDCPNVSYRPIAFREFSENKGVGEIVSDNNTPDSKFEPVQSNTWAAGVFNTVCKIK